MEAKVKKVDALDDIWVLWNRTAQAIRRAREVELHGVAGLSLIEASVIYFVKASREPVTPAILARSLYREPHTISGLISRMENRGLVRKEKNLARKNQVRVVLTKKGEQAFKEQSKADAAQKDLISCLSEKDRDNLNVCLEKLHKKAIELIRESKRLPYQ